MRTRSHAIVVVLLMSVVSAGQAVADDVQPGMIAQGTVRDAKNAPIANANVQLCYEKNQLNADNAVVETVQTDEGGKYQFKTPLRFATSNGTVDSDHYVVVAYDATHAPGWANIIGTRTQTMNDLVLDNATPQDVQVTDSQGTPLSDVVLRLAGAGDPQDRYAAFRQLSTFPPDMIAVTEMTDAQGAATLKNLPHTQLQLVASHPGYADATIRLGAPQKEALPIKMMPAATVKGTVRDLQGQPVSGVTVIFLDINHVSARAVKTDEKGNYECDSLAPKGASAYSTGVFSIFVRDSKFCSSIRTLNLDSSATIDPFDLKAEPGSVLRIKVVEPQTKKPVAGAQVCVMLPANLVRGEFTDDKGSVDFRMAPAEGVIRLSAPPGGSYFVGDPPGQKFKLSDQLTEITLTLPSALKPLVDLRGYVETADGKPGASMKVMMACDDQEVRLPPMPGFSFGAVTTPDGSFTTAGFPSESRIIVYAETRNHKTAAVVQYDVPKQGGDLKPPIKLMATKASDFDFSAAIGQDESGAHVYVSPGSGNVFLRYSRDTTIDAKGHLKISGIIPGQVYHVVEIGGKMGPQVQKDLVLVPKG
ncbi:MAG TPA: carboxypeptidase-like regulatory domain-containing protein [Tepidisphaeraceae bacterium]|jgi:protocatechuate 3,4-dioxygenase beta subunit|nr:carboxypeptidase-like regulatory domain-containing protein [Tepidisphaeraceae bacterium]